MQRTQTNVGTPQRHHDDSSTSSFSGLKKSDFLPADLPTCSDKTIAFENRYVSGQIVRFALAAFRLQERLRCFPSINVGLYMHSLFRTFPIA